MIRKRCAIYIRKSTEEGLEQDFNSLDAQREACAAYILSQKHEGWAERSERYDDGGFSGGSMDRGRVTVSCRSRFSFRLLYVQKPRGFSSLMRNVYGVDCRSH